MGDWAGENTELENSRPNGKVDVSGIAFSNPDVRSVALKSHTLHCPMINTTIRSRGLHGVGLAGYTHGFVIHAICEPRGFGK